MGRNYDPSALRDGCLLIFFTSRHDIAALDLTGLLVSDLTSPASCLSLTAMCHRWCSRLVTLLILAARGESSVLARLADKAYYFNDNRASLCGVSTWQGYVITRDAR